MICNHCQKEIPPGDGVSIKRWRGRSIGFHTDCFIEVAGEEFLPAEYDSQVDQAIDTANQIYHEQQQEKLEKLKQEQVTPEEAFGPPND